VSKRHQNSRRKSYGRRQHELRERAGQYRPIGRIELTWDDDAEAAPRELAFLEPRAPGLRFAMGD
jgi:hypothetical protein